jgi:hypothetical protein
MKPAPINQRPGAMNQHSTAWSEPLPRWHTFFADGRVRHRISNAGVRDSRHGRVLRGLRL